MQYKIHTDPKRITGKRPNLSAQNTVADDIVTAFTSQQEQPIVPLSSTATGKPSPWGKIFGTLAAALVLPAIAQESLLPEGFGNPADTPAPRPTPAPSQTPAPTSTPGPITGLAFRSTGAAD